MALGPGKDDMDLTRMAEKLRKVALTYPETYEESPWGDRVVKVRGKIFFFCGAHEGSLSLSVKLPRSGREVLKNRWARPTPYGLGKSGWVSASFPGGKGASEEHIARWIDESYRALAPKKLIKLLDEPAAPKKASTAARPSTKVTKLKHRVLLVCEDPLRTRRATDELLARGVSAKATPSVGAARKQLARLDAVIIDVGRSQDEGLALAGEIDASDHAIHLFVVGIRDGAAHKRAQTAATSAALFRDPPGDPAVAEAIAGELRRHD
jgi:predicted DNA-binding protein (MmcQ/YjbR family)